MVQWKVRFQSNNADPTYYWGSLMHGALMERVAAETADRMHKGEMRLFNQWVEPAKDGTFTWHLNVLDDGLADEMPTYGEGDEWMLTHVSTALTVLSAERVDTSIRDYMKPFYMSEKPADRIRMTFITTTTHKSQGAYAVFPSVELIAGNLRKRIVTMDPESVLGDDEVIRQITDRTIIGRYKLQSSAFALEGRWIHGYNGVVELVVRGPEALLRLANALYAFAPYCGVGIKTALGMGGCSVELIQRSE